MQEGFALPLRSPAVSLVDADPDALEAAEDMMGEQFCWLAVLLNWFAEKHGFDAVCKVRLFLTFGTAKGHALL